MASSSVAILGVPGVLGKGSNIFSFTVTTTGAQTLTLQDLGIASGKIVRVWWGDDTYNDYTGTGTRTHAYGGAGTWTVRMSPASAITVIDFRDTKITLNQTLALCRSVTSLRIDNISGFNSQYISSMALTYLNLYFPVAGTYTFNSQHISSMALTYLNLHFTAAGTYTFNSQHISSMALTYLYLRLGVAGTYTFNSQHISSMALTGLSLYFDVAGTYTFNSQHISSMALTTLYVVLHAASTTKTIARSDWSGEVVRRAQSPTIQMGLTAEQVSDILLGIYDMASSGARTVTGGTLNVAGSNAAPTGVLQAACPPTTGKEAAYELVNDTCGVIPAGEEFAAVTINN